MSGSELTGLSGGALAYLGDAVFELTVRRTLLERGLTSPGALNRAALEYVTAVAQSRAVEKILPLLSEEEADVFRRGRNASCVTPPRSATQAEYRRATGLEALFAYLYLKGETVRITELFSAGFAAEQKTTGDKSIP
jgi:ribonuclease-3 family protein